MPPVAEILQGSLVERYVTYGNPSCKCAKGERHGPVRYLTVMLGRGRATGGITASEKVDQVQGWIDRTTINCWIENYQLKDRLKFSEINRELLRRERAQQRLADSHTFFAPV